MSHRGFSLAELMLAIGTIAACILTIMVLVLALSRSSRKSMDVSVSELAADQILTRVLYRADWDDHAHFWDQDDHSPYVTGTFTVNRNEFAYTLDASTVRDNSSVAIGQNKAHNRVKLVTLQLSWWDGTSGNRTGYGKLSAQIQRLVHEEEH